MPKTDPKKEPASFEEGRALVDFCGKQLTAIERKVEILTRRADGTAAAEPFKEEP